MNCFVIMPFAPEFDDVYETIKSAVEGATDSRSGRCFRLDESRPAGRITERLLNELTAADLCVADLSLLSPNVMWETGFSMALGTPTILVTQDERGLPFDLQDFLVIRYERTRLRATLADPLKRSVIDTMQARDARVRNNVRPSDERSSQRSSESLLVADLFAQITELKTIVGEAVRTWNASPVGSVKSPLELSRLEELVGNWTDTQSGCRLYARMIGGDFVVPYSWGDSNDLSAVFYGWERVSEHWFARFSWIDIDLKGFTFIRNSAVDTYVGSWWDDGEAPRIQVSANSPGGVPIRLVRSNDVEDPPWLGSFLEGVEAQGIDAYLRDKGVTP